jgi:hypothetical protein
MKTNMCFDDILPEREGTSSEGEGRGKTYALSS